MLLNFFVIAIVNSASAAPAYLPKGECDQVIQHDHYSLCYSYEHRQALWTTHEITPENLAGSQKRTDDFREDPMVHDPVNEKDYFGSGFDRGHMVPAADMKFSQEAMSQSFYMTNMSPQRANFNRQIWAKLEKELRGWVKADGDAYVVTAPVLSPDLLQIKSGVSVPEYYYKIAYFPKKKVMKAFLMPNQDLKGQSIYMFSVSVDEIEKLTGLDFFSELPNKLEKELEAASYY